jgi:hypothetical protein
VLAEWNKVCAGVELFNAEFAKLGEGDLKHREAISVTVVKIHEAIRDTDARASLLAAGIGHAKEYGCRGEETVWDSIGRLCDGMEEVKKHADFGTREMPQLIADSRKAKVKLSTLSQNFHGLSKYAIHKKIHKIGEDGGAGLGGSGQRRPAVGDPAFDRLQSRLDDLENQAQEYSKIPLGGSVGVVGRGGHADRKLATLGVRVDTLEQLANESDDAGSQKDESLQDEVGELTRRVVKAESRGNDESFELYGFAFASFSDCLTMVVLEKIPSSGLFWDLFSALISMRPKGQTGKEWVDEQYSSECIQVTTLENSLLASMSHSRPPCLYAKGGVGALVELEEGFGACTSYAQWISRVESIKKVLGKQLKDFALGVLGNMVPNAGGNGLAKALLSEIKAQWYELVSWLDELYKELTEEANFKAKPAWQLIGRCVAAILDAIAEVR